MVIMTMNCGAIHQFSGEAARSFQLSGLSAVSIILLEQGEGEVEVPIPYQLGKDRTRHGLKASGNSSQLQPRPRHGSLLYS